MRSLRSRVSDSNKESSSFTLTSKDLNKILFSLAFTAGWSSNVNSYQMKEYKKLWDELNENGKKTFGEDIYADDWNDYEIQRR